MANASDGQDQTGREPARRLRFDDLAAIVLRNTPGTNGTSMAEAAAGGHSGRRFVLAAGVAVLLIWGTLYLIFRDWRAKYRERARYGATQVVPAIDPLRSIVPPDVGQSMWHDAIDQTRAMLLTVTGSNLLDVKEMNTLRVELADHVRRGRDHPATAVGELAEIWNQVADRGEFLLRDSRSRSGDRHPRPRIIPSYGATRVVPAIEPLRAIVPAGVDPVAWRDAIDQTRAKLLALTDSHPLDVREMGRLRAELSRHVSRACDQPATAVAELAQIWDQVADRNENLRPRPKILPPRSLKPEPGP